jgi:hypothetical protein
VIAELAHRLRLTSRPGQDRRADALRVVERDRDLVSADGVGGEIDPLSAALPEESPHPVAACDLRRNVGWEGLDRGRLGRSTLEQLGSAGVAEPGTITILVPTGRTPHVLTKYPKSDPPVHPESPLSPPVVSRAAHGEDAGEREKGSDDETTQGA